MNHVVLLGDSIFDNHAYVNGGPAVVDHLRRGLPSGWRATLLALDGAVTCDVLDQLRQVPDDVSHLVISAGGNDALEHAGMVLYARTGSYAEVMSRLAGVQEQFRADYREMVEAAVSLGKPVSLCTVYESIPGLEPSLVAGLSLFNDVILRQAIHQRLALIDLREICTETSDYAATSPIEPSIAGGAKIATAIVRAVTTPLSQWNGCRVLGR